MNSKRETKLQQESLHQEMDQSKRMPSGKNSSVVHLLVVLVAIGMSLEHGVQALDDKCVPTATKPNLDAIKVENVASIEDQVLANLAGYVEFYNSTGPELSQSTYLPLDIKSVSVGPPGQGGIRTVTLLGDCSKFEIKYKLEDGNFFSAFHVYYVFRGLEMFVKNGAEQDEKAKKICDFDKPFSFKLDSRMRYWCIETWSHQCSKREKPIAQLVLKSFELELDVDSFSQPLAFGKLPKFNKSRFLDSCRYWNM